MSKEVDETILQKYLSGACNENDLRQIKEYLDNEEYTTSLEVWMTKDWKSFDKSEPKKKAPVFNLTRVAAAAVVIGLILSAWLFASYRETKNNNEWITFSNNAGRQSILFLPDSSRIYLGAASSVQYNKNYSVTNRDIKLEGEAYFVVNHEHDYSFNVITGALKTIDIGTEFNIRYIKNDPEIEVSVSNGTVDVVSNMESNIPLARLNKDQRMVFNSLTNSYVTDTVTEAASIGGWRNGLLSFRKKTLAQVAEELHRYYNVNVHFDNEESREILITTSLQESTIDDAIEIISITAGVEIKRKGKTISIR